MKKLFLAFTVSLLMTGIFVFGTPSAKASVDERVDIEKVTTESELIQLSEEEIMETSITGYLRLLTFQTMRTQYLDYGAPQVRYTGQKYKDFSYSPSYTRSVKDVNRTTAIDSIFKRSVIDFYYTYRFY